MRRRLSVWLLTGLLLASARCTFPQYNTPAGAAGSSAGAGGISAGGASGVAGAGATQNAAGASVALGGGDGNAGASGGPVECVGEQWPVDSCPGGCLTRFPEHCYDGDKNEDEVAPDCGGSCQGCTNEACTGNDDCLSGTCRDDAGTSACQAPLSIKYTAHETSPIVGSTTWSITLSNEQADGGKAYSFQGLKLRYYFDRDGIVEPLVVRATQSNLMLSGGESRALSKTTWSIAREEHLSNSAYDAYLEVAFGDAGQLFPGDQIDLYQQLLTGDPGRSTFDQRANYSFASMPDAASLHIAVFYHDQLVWGLEPAPANPRSCLARGVNLNGPVVTVDGHAWESAQQADISTSGAGVSQATAPFPAVTGDTASMLATATRLGVADELSFPAANGNYLLYLYATSPGNDAEASLFTVQGAEPDGSAGFRAQASDGGQVWARLGPYRVDVTEGKVAVGVSKGSINFAGVELWYPN